MKYLTAIAIALLPSSTEWVKPIIWICVFSRAEVSCIAPFAIFTKAPVAAVAPAVNAVEPMAFSDWLIFPNCPTKLSALSIASVNATPAASENSVNSSRAFLPKPSKLLLARLLSTSSAASFTLSKLSTASSTLRRRGATSPSNLISTEPPSIAILVPCVNPFVF